MQYYDVRQPLYLIKDASGIELDTKLIQVREYMNCVFDETPGNQIL